MTTNSQATTIALARRLAMADNRNQQAAIVQCAARMLEGADDEFSSQDILEIADEIEAIKGWGKNEQA